MGLNEERFGTHMEHHAFHPCQASRNLPDGTHGAHFSLTKKGRTKIHQMKGVGKGLTLDELKRRY